MLLPPTIEEYVESGSIVRAIDALVRSLTTETLAELGFAHARTAGTGRPPYDPRDLLALLLWGYVRGVTGSRRLEAATKVNLEVIWLLRGLQPDFWVICSFRRQNAEAVKELMRHYVRMLQEEALVGGEAMAQDGSKFRAANSKDRNFTKASLENQIKRIGEKVDRYLEAAEQSDQSEEPRVGTEAVLTGEVLNEKIERLRQRQAELLSIQQEMKKNRETQRSLTDPESRRMKTGGTSNICYNAQIAVDHKYGLIVAGDVTNEVNDQHQLSALALEVKETLGVETLDVFADKGYSNGSELAKCEDNQITPYVPQPEISTNKKKKLFTKKQFQYDESSDSFRCPAGEILTFASECVESGRKVRYYTTPKCKGCPLRSKCTSDKQGRRITRHEHDDAILRAALRTRERPEAMKLRKCLAEHPFGTIKRWMNGAHFLTKGLRNVTTEFLLMAIAFNLKRVHSIKAAIASPGAN